MNARAEAPAPSDHSVNFSETGNQTAEKLSQEANLSQRAREEMSQISPPAPPRVEQGQSEAPLRLDTANKGGLPTLDIVENDTVRGSARQIRESLQRSSLYFFSRPDGASVLRTLSAMNDGERSRLEETYRNEFGPQANLREDLRRYLSPAEYQRAIGLLERRNGQTDDASNLQAALQESDPTKREAQLRLLYRTLSSNQIEDMHSQYEARFGSLDAALQSARLSDGSRQAIETYRTAARENRPVTAQERESIARTGLRERNRDLIAESLSGDSAEAREARSRLNYQRDFQRVFGTDPILRDYIQEGRVRLATIANANSGFFGSRENIDDAIRLSTADERRQFRQGYELSQRNAEQSSLNPQEQQSLQFYRTLQNQFERAGNRGEVMRWQDFLINGRETVISQLGRIEQSGLIWGSSHSRLDANNAVSNLSERDWRILRNAEHGQTEIERTQGRAFRQQVEGAINRFAQSPEEAQSLMRIINSKLEQDNYSDARRIGRSLDESLADASSGAPYHRRRETMAALTGMTPEQARQYRDDPEVRRRVNEQLAGAEAPIRELATRILARVAVNGEPPRLEGLERLRSNLLLARSPSIAEIQELSRDPEVIARLGLPDHQLSNEDRMLNNVILSGIHRALSSRQLADRPQLAGEPFLSPSTIMAEAQRLRRQMLENGGQLSPEQQYRLNLPMNDIYRSLPTASQSDRESFINRLDTSPQRQDLARHILSQNGEMRLEDLARSYSIEGGDPGPLQQALAAASPQELAEARRNWAQKYPGDMAASILGKANDAQRPGLRAVLNPVGDGRQNLYDNYNAYLERRGGFTFDGTGMTLERVAQLHQEALQAYNRSREGLTQEQLRELDSFFGMALQQHRDSTERHTQILLDAAITAATLGSGSALTVAGIAGRIAAGALTNLGAMAATRGEFDPHAAVGDMINGGVAAITGRAAREGGRVFVPARSHAEIPPSPSARPLEISPARPREAAPRPQEQSPVRPSERVPRAAGPEITSPEEMRRTVTADILDRAQLNLRETLPRAEGEIRAAREAFASGRIEEAQAAYNRFAQLTGRQVPRFERIPPEGMPGTLNTLITDAEQRLRGLDELVNGGHLQDNGRRIALNLEEINRRIKIDLAFFAPPKNHRGSFISRETAAELRQIPAILGDSKAPHLAARTINTLADPALRTTEERYQSLRELLGTKPALDSLRNQRATIERALRESGQDAAEFERLIQRAEREIAWLRNGQALINDAAAGGQLLRFEQAPSRQAIENAISGMQFPSAEARQNFLNTAERFFGNEANKNAEHGFAIIARPDGRHFLMRMAPGEEENSLKMFLQPVEQNGLPYGLNAPDRDLHLLFRTIQEADGIKKFRLVEIKQGTSSNPENPIFWQHTPMPGRRQADPEKALEYFRNSPWRNVDDLRSYLETLVQGIRYRGARPQ